MFPFHYIVIIPTSGLVSGLKRKSAEKVFILHSGASKWLNSVNQSKIIVMSI